MRFGCDDFTCEASPVKSSILWPTDVEVAASATPMIGHAIAHDVAAYLGRQAHRPWFPCLVGVCALVVTITLTFPVEFLVVASVLLNRRRWIVIGLLATLGSSLASLALYMAFHHLGWNILLEWYPDIATTKVWTDSVRWLSEYGTIALFVLMAVPLPIPKTPALAIVAIYRMPVHEVILAISVGKILKYTGYAFGTSRFPAFFGRWYEKFGIRRALPTSGDDRQDAKSQLPPTT